MRFFNQKKKKIKFKWDLSPVTEADRQASLLICGKLLSTGINIISEEGKIPDYKTRKNWDRVWIIDPIDGTRDFIKGGGDFTVNIALIIWDKTELGVIYAPFTSELFYGIKGMGAFKQNLLQENYDLELFKEMYRISADEENKEIIIVTTKSHGNLKNKKFIENILLRHNSAKIIKRGSSIKYCLLAEGKANIFPRLSVINEWDTAAGQAIAEASGCTVTQLDGISPILYNKKILTTPENIVASSKRLIKNLL